VLYTIDKCKIFCKKKYIYIYIFFHSQKEYYFSFITLPCLLKKNLPIFFLLNLTLHTKTNVILILIYKIRYINKPSNQLYRQ